MPLVLSGAPDYYSTTDYCSVTDVRNFGVGSSVTNSAITAAIALAEAIINNYTGTIFGQASPRTYTVSDVRKPIVVLPNPFKNITEVTIDQVAFTTYIVEDWGLRLYRSGYYDSDGFPRWQTDLLNSDYGGGIYPSIYGSQVSVTATFGYPDIPLTVAQACKMQAARFATSGAGSLLPDPKITMLQVEQYKIQLSSGGAQIDSTGDETVDRLLSPYRDVRAMVG